MVYNSRLDKHGAGGGGVDSFLITNWKIEQNE